MMDVCAARGVLMDFLISIWYDHFWGERKKFFIIMKRAGGGGVGGGDKMRGEREREKRTIPEFSESTHLHLHADL